MMIFKLDEMLMYCWYDACPLTACTGPNSFAKSMDPHRASWVEAETRVSLPPPRVARKFFIKPCIRKTCFGAIHKNTKSVCMALGS